ncbi:Cell wall-associated polypeptide CWBP200 [Serratia marcescens]|nr:Cell wall-associated polypeptide CWBP200 [Serratia marcescens]
MGRLRELNRLPTVSGAALGIEPDSVQMRYDAAGRLLGEQGVNGELQYQWDALANLQALTLPQGDRLQWLYYGSGHASAIKFNQQVVSEFTRDRLHRETGRSQGALQQQRRYDAMGRRSWQSSAFGHDKLTRPEDGVLWRAYRYTGRGELAGVSDALRGEVHYGYDAEGRLLQHREPNQGKPGARLVYDLADNLLGERSPQSDIDAHLPLAPIADNRLTHWQKLFYRYDAWGNLISRRNGLYEQHYRYDADNRLVQAHGRGPQGEFEVQYHYDALGRRSRKAVRYKGKTEQTTRFLWQGYRLLQEQRDDGSRRSWSYDPASPWSPLAALEQAGDSRSADIYWYHTDLNSAPLEVTDAAGNLCWSGQYDTFGKLQGQTVAGAAKRQGAQYQQPLRYAGQYQDDESGLHYNLFRYYEPEVGRFTTQDPIGLRGGLNLYQYAPNPLMWVDPLGLMSCGASKGFARKDRIARRWVDKLSGKKPADVDAFLTSRGWAKHYPQAGRPEAIQHTQYVRTTKSGATYKLDYHPGGNASQPNIHGNDYWKVYKVENGEDVVFGRIGHGEFKNYDLIKDSPVYVDGVIKNGGI